MVGASHASIRGAFGFQVVGGSLESEAAVEWLADAMRAFAEATAEPSALLDTVARRTSEALDAYCVLGLVSEDGQRIEFVAVFDPDRATLERLQREILPSQHRLADHVAQLPHVPRPRLLLEQGERIGSDLVDRPAQLDAGLGHEPLHEMGDVGGSFAERGQRDRVLRESEIEIRAETAILGTRVEIFVGRCDEPHVERG